MRHLGKLLWVIFLLPFLTLAQGINFETDSVLTAKLSALQGLKTEKKIKKLLNLSSSYFPKDYETAVVIAEQAFDIALAYDDNYYIARSCDQIAQFHIQHGQYIRSVEILRTGLYYAEKSGNQDYIAYLENTLGALYGELKQYEIALSFLHSAYENWKSTKNIRRVNTLNNIANVEALVSRYSQAITHLNEALEIAEKEGSKALKSQVYYCLGFCYSKKGDHALALEYFNQSSSNTKLPPPVATKLLSNIANCYTQLGNYSEGIKILQRLDSIGKENDIPQTSLWVATGYAELFDRQGNAELALLWYKRSISKANLIPYKETSAQELRQKMAAIYAREGDFEQAYKLSKEYIEATDSIQSEKVAHQIGQLEANYNLREKERQIFILQKEKQFHRYLIWGVSCLAVLLILVLFLGYNSYRIKQVSHEALKDKSHEIETRNNMLSYQSHEIKAQNDLLKQTNLDLKQFAYAISHDLREPLRTIRAYLQLLQKRYSPHLDDDAQTFIGFARDGATRMDKLLRDLLGYTHLTQKSLSVTELDLNQIIKRIHQNLQYQITKNEALIHLPSPLPAIRGIETEIELLFQNLIQNAIKFRRESSPIIIIQAEERENFFILSVSDNGIGIDPEHFDRIFKLFQRLHNQDYDGTGMGLALCKRIVEKAGGSIWLKSELNKGSTFYIKWPTNPRSRRLDERHSKKIN